MTDTDDEQVLAAEGAEEVIKTDGLDRGGYHYAHGQQYYKDGRFCEPPKKIDTAAAASDEPPQPIAASQSKWNTNDYHWEERDISQMVKEMLNQKLLGVEFWRDKKTENDALVISSCEIEGWAVSNVRKGSTKNLWEFSVKIHFHGLRGGAELAVCVTIPNLDQDINFDVLPQAQIDSQPGKNLVFSKSLDAHGNVVEKIVGEVDAERAMKTNELFLNFVRRKGVPLIQTKVTELMKELFDFGKNTQPLE
jgi:hypothetical protein